jgi:hypothetical protein
MGRNIDAKRLDIFSVDSYLIRLHSLFSIPLLMAAEALAFRSQAGERVVIHVGSSHELF